MLHFQGHFYVYRVCTFGHRAAPLLWCRCAALLGRHGQCIVRDEECRLNIFMDDPCFVFTVQRHVARVLLLWLAYGVPLEWTKAHGGQAVQWAGATLSVADPTTPTIAIEEARRVNLVKELHSLLSVNMVQRKVVRSLGGTISQVLAIIPHLSVLQALSMPLEQEVIPRNWFTQSESAMTFCGYYGFLRLSLVVRYGFPLRGFRVTSGLSSLTPR